MTEQSDSLRCSDAQEFERWRNAGELFGRVKKGLGFGDVALYEDDSGLGDFRLQWWFNAKGQRYSAAYTVLDEELASVMSIDLIAANIVSKWKRESKEKFDGKGDLYLG